MPGRKPRTPVTEHPGKILARKLREKGWTQAELAAVMGWSRQGISGVVSGRSGITPDKAVALGAVFGDDPAEWLKWSADYQLSTADADTGAIERRARLYESAPIRDMQKRGWIAETDGIEGLELELERFFGSAVGDSIQFPVAARRTVELNELTAAERAWCFRARNLAALIPPTGRFSPKGLPALEGRLRRLAAYPKEARKVSRVLMEAGIRFVVIEPLPTAKIDGAAFWLDEASPVIAVSLRYDRIDAFWFTLMHEFAHIKHGDQHSVDSDLLHEAGHGISVTLAEDEAEQRANEAASEALVPKEELDSFVRRLAPYYSADRIVQFAHRVRIHPGIIVGQLQHRGEVGYSALRDFLVKIRPVVIETALTDGWGQSISPSLA